MERCRSCASWRRCMTAVRGSYARFRRADPRSKIFTNRTMNRFYRKMLRDVSQHEAVEHLGIPYIGATPIGATADDLQDIPDGEVREGKAIEAVKISDKNCCSSKRSMRDALSENLKEVDVTLFFTIRIFIARRTNDVLTMRNGCRHYQCHCCRW